MNKNAKLIAGLKKMQEGISDVVDALEDGAELPINAPEVEKKEEKKATVGKPATAKTPGKTADNSVNTEEKTGKTESKSSGKVTKEQLDAMTYNSLKQYAKENGVPAVGNRDQITSAILAKVGGATASAPSKAEKKEEKTPAPKGGKVVPMRKKEEVKEEQEEATDSTDEVSAQVNEAVAEMSTEEIADFLASAGVSAKGKRQALIDRLIQAVIDGTISLTDDDDDASEESGDEDEADGAEDEDDNVNDPENPDMTEERKEAIAEMDKDIRKQWKKKELSRDDLEEFLKDFYETDDLSEYTDADLLDMYIDAACRLIDDSGETIEDGSYMLNGQPACCGRFLDYDEAEGVYKCSHCENTYEASEE
jgi:hypothetical protein